MKNKIQQDLNNGMFYKICSNETTFREYIFPLIDKAIAEERERVRGEIDKLYSISDVAQDSCDNYKQKVLDLLSFLNNK